MIRVRGEPIERVTKTPRTVTEIRAASRKVGRPRKDGALSAAERAKAYRERRKTNGKAQG